MRKQIYTAAMFPFVWSFSALAQGVPQPDPVYAKISYDNVDPISGSLSLDISDFRIGELGDRLPIDFVRTYRSPSGGVFSNIDPFGEGWSHNYIIGAHYYAGPIGSNGHEMHIIIGRELYKFSALLVNGVWSYGNDLQQNGATARSLNISGVTNVVFTTHDGYTYYFPHDDTHTVSNNYNDGPGPVDVLTSMVDKIVAPNGEVLKFIYQKTANSGSVRLEAIRHSRGYGIAFKYISAAALGVRSASKQTINQIVLADNLCPTFPYNCNETSFRKFNYAYQAHSYDSSKYKLYTMTDAASSVYKYQYQANNITSPGKVYLSDIFMPTDGSTPSISFTYGNSTWGFMRRVISSMKFNNGTTYFEYPTACSSTGETKRTDPTGGITRIKYSMVLDGEPDVYTWCAGKGIEEQIDPLGRATQFRYTNSYQVYSQHGGRNQLTKITSPEGNFVATTLDQRGNIITQLNKPKLGSSEADTIVSAVFEACTVTNFRYCNNPIRVVDAKGNRTDYIWSDVHGGLLSEERGLNSSGICAVTGGCPKITYGYDPFTGTDGATFYLISSKTEKINATQTVVTTYTYNSAAAHFTLRGELVTADGVSLRTCYTYNAWGLKVSETKPRAGLTSCP